MYLLAEQPRPIHAPFTYDPQMMRSTALGAGQNGPQGSAG